jgi:hypothetical protein
MSNDSLTRPFMSCSDPLLLRSDGTSPTPFWTWEDLMKARAVAMAMARRRDDLCLVYLYCANVELCWTIYCVMTSGWLCQTLYCVAEYFCFCVLFWRLPIRGSSQNMLYIKNQYIRQLTDEYFIVSYSVASPVASDSAMPRECCITSSVQAPPPHRTPIEAVGAAPDQIFLHSHKRAPHSTLNI